MFQHSILLLHEDIVPSQNVGDLLLQCGDPIVTPLHLAQLLLQQVPDRHQNGVSRKISGKSRESSYIIVKER